MKQTIPKDKPKIIQYRDYKKFEENNFRIDLRERLQNEVMQNLKTYFLKF